MPGPTIGGVGEGGVLLTGVAAALTTSFQEFQDNLESVSIPMHVLHSVPGPAPAQVTNLSCQPLVATQRRRLR